MDFLEHDLKTLQEDMLDAFSPSEIKTLLLQLTSAVDYLHSNWILHRDLKTSNLLMNNRGRMKVADFGMARYYGDPPPKLTQLVVTLWYRAPELLLGTEKYGAEVDMWSVGCIFGELLKKEPLLQGKNEVDELSKASFSPIINNSLLSNRVPDLRPLRYPHRIHLARLQAPPQRPLSPPPQQPPNHRLRHPRPFSPPNQCWHIPLNLAAQPKPSPQTHGQRSARTPLLQGGSAPEVFSHVSNFPVEGGTGEEEEGG